MNLKNSRLILRRQYTVVVKTNAAEEIPVELIEQSVCGRDVAIAERLGVRLLVSDRVRRADFPKSGRNPFSAELKRMLT